MIKSTLKLVAAIVLFASCNQYEKAPSGMPYKITHGSGNEKVIKNGQIIKFNLEYKIKSKNLVYMTTADQMPGYIQYDSIGFASAKYTFQEIMGKIRKGDKIEFSLSVDSLLKKGQIPAARLCKNQSLPKQAIENFVSVGTFTGLEGLL